MGVTFSVTFDEQCPLTGTNVPRKQWISARRAAGTRPSAVVWKINVQVWRSRLGVKNASPGREGRSWGTDGDGAVAQQLPNDTGSKFKSDTTVA
jgi:hypothetical protein